MATAQGGTLTIVKTAVHVRPAGDAMISLEYRNAAGVMVLRRNVHVPADRTKPIVDNQGTQLSAQVPAGLANAIDAFNAQVDTTITNAANAGKLDL